MKDKVITIQATAKRFKAAAFIGAVGFCVSFPMLLVAHQNNAPTGTAWAGLIVSLAILSYGKIGKWWRHE